MPHQVVITFDIDENKVAENAEKEAGRQVARQIIDGVFGSGYGQSGAMKKYLREVIEEMIEPEKDKIIKEAVTEVIGNLHRTKVVKDMLADAPERKPDGADNGKR